MTTIISKNNQSIFDMCLQAYGGIEYMDDLLSHNPTLRYDSEIYVGQEIIYDDTIGIRKINQKRDTEDIKYSNGQAYAGFVLATQDGDYVVTDGGDFIIVDI